MSLDDGRNPEYPAHDPPLPELPGITLKFDPYEVHAWSAWQDGVCIARSPWKKLTWKEAQKCV